MKKQVSIIFISLLFMIQAFSQSAPLAPPIPPPPCYANDNDGLGGAVGLNSFLRSDDGATIELHVTYYSGGEFNDVFVLYFANGTTGRSVIDASIDDDEDAHRIAISNSNVYGFGSTITFPSGFEATHAIAVDSNSGSLYSIPSSGNVGTGELNFIKSVTTNSQNTPYDITFDRSDIGLSGYDDFYFVGLYVGHNGYTSDEGYGEGITKGTQGSDNVVFTGYKSFANCTATLGSKKLSKDFFNAYFIDGNLKINELNDMVTIKIYDISGKLHKVTKHQVNGEISIPMGLAKNQLYIVDIESSSSNKILKVIPH